MFLGKNDGVKDWSPRPDIFPQGLKHLQVRSSLNKSRVFVQIFYVFQAKIDIPLVAHNRYWASDNIYAEQNGGNYSFILGILSF